MDIIPFGGRRSHGRCVPSSSSLCPFIRLGCKATGLTSWSHSVSLWAPFVLFVILSQTGSRTSIGVGEGVVDVTSVGVASFPMVHDISWYLVEKINKDRRDRQMDMLRGCLDTNCLLDWVDYKDHWLLMNRCFNFVNLSVADGVCSSSWFALSPSKIWVFATVRWLVKASYEPWTFERVKFEPLAKVSGFCQGGQTRPTYCPV